MSTSPKDPAEQLNAAFNLIAARNAAAEDTRQARPYLTALESTPKKLAREARCLFELTPSQQVREAVVDIVRNNLGRLVATDPTYAISTGKWCVQHSPDYKRPNIITHVLAAALPLQVTQPKIAIGAAIWALSCERKEGQPPDPVQTAMHLLVTTLARSANVEQTLELARFMTSKAATLADDDQKQVRTIAADAAVSAIVENWKKLSDDELVSHIDRLSPLSRPLSSAMETSLQIVTGSIAQRLEEAALRVAQTGRGLPAARALLAFNKAPFWPAASAGEERRSGLIGQIVAEMPMREVFALWTDDRLNLASEAAASIAHALKQPLAPFLEGTPGDAITLAERRRAREILTALADENAPGGLRREVLPLDKPGPMRGLINRLFPSQTPA